MDNEQIIERVIASAKLGRSSLRSDVEKELRAHFEDAREHGGHPAAGEDPSQADCFGFGDPDEIGRELAFVHRFERRAILAADSVLLLVVSTLTAASFVMLFQTALAAWAGIPPAHAFPWLRGQAIAFVSLSFGYIGLYLGERFGNLGLGRALVLNLAIFPCIFALATPLLHLRSIAPALPFAAGASVRLLERTPLRSYWYLGTILPTVAAWMLVPHLFAAGAHAPAWMALGFRWVGQTAACYLLSLVSRSHRKWSLWH